MALGLLSLDQDGGGSYFARQNFFELEQLN